MYFQISCLVTHFIKTFFGCLFILNRSKKVHCAIESQLLSIQKLIAAKM